MSQLLDCFIHSSDSQNIGNGDWVWEWNLASRRIRRKSYINPVSQVHMYAGIHVHPHTCKQTPPTFRQRVHTHIHKEKNLEKKFRYIVLLHRTVSV